jgi:deoxyribose-phosphate aldolase
MAMDYASAVSQTPTILRDAEPSWPRLGRVGSVDAVALEARAADLAKRSIKRESKLRALELVVRMTDLTTLEGADTPGKVAALCAKAMRPDPVDLSVPAVAAVCVYPTMIAPARARLGASGVRVASVATGFPSGQYPIALRVADARAAAELGADEIDMVIDRGAFLSGRHAEVYDQIVQVREVIGGAHLKVILETGELGTYDNVRRASLLAMAAGADFIKTSTGKISPAATLPVALCMLEAIRDVQLETGRMVGMKPAGGIRTAKQAIQHLCIVNETVGPDWLTPELFRFGASSLLNDVLMQIRTQKTGVYESLDHFTVD